MNIELAQQDDFDIVKNITYTTINKVFSHYYLNDVIAFFLDLHNDKNIKKDIAEKTVYIEYDENNKPVGTVTIKGNEICRLFVLPDSQGNGYGRNLLEFAEKEIFKEHNEIVLNAALSAKAMYLKRGYREVKYNVVKTKHDDFLCYDVMAKCL